MTCPHCHLRIPTGQERRRQAYRARGLCIDCTVPSKTLRCFDCRVKHSVREQRYRARRKAKRLQQRIA